MGKTQDTGREREGTGTLLVWPPCAAMLTVHGAAEEAVEEGDPWASSCGCPKCLFQAALLDLTRSGEGNRIGLSPSSELAAQLGLSKVYSYLPYSHFCFKKTAHQNVGQGCVGVK